MQTTSLVRQLLAPIALLVSIQAAAQPNSVDIDLVPAADPEQMEVRLRFNGDDFGEVFSGLVFTIRWEEASPALLPLGTPFCVGAAFPINASAHVVSSGYRYRTWNMEGMAQLQADPDLDGGCGFSFPEGEWVTILTLAPIGNDGCTEFQIVNDTFTEANNRNFYVSLNGHQANTEGTPFAALIETESALVGACALDCAGVIGGEAFLDECDQCVGGTTGEEACVQDCNGTWGGTAYLDNCADCVGGDTGAEPCTQDCSGEWGGPAVVGSACDDDDPCTINDLWNAECFCMGSPAFTAGEISGPDTVLVGEVPVFTIGFTGSAEASWELPEGWNAANVNEGSVETTVGGDPFQEVEICVTLSSGDCDEQVCVTVWVDGGLGVVDGPSTDQFVVWPNPSNGQFFLDAASGGDHRNLAVFDMVGRQVALPVQASPGKPAVIDLSAHAAGTYLLRSLDPTDQQAIKLIVIR